MSQTNDDDRQAATSRPNDVIAAVLEDHADIKSMMNDVGVANRNGERQQAFERLVAKLAVHETAEEEVVHPLAKKEAHAEEVVAQRLDEENKGKRALAGAREDGHRPRRSSIGSSTRCEARSWRMPSAKKKRSCLGWTRGSIRTSSSGRRRRFAWRSGWRPPTRTPTAPNRRRATSFWDPSWRLPTARATPSAT